MALAPTSISIQLKPLCAITGEDGASVEREMSALIERCRAVDSEIAADARVTLVREPFEIAEDAPFVATVRAAAAHRLGSPPPVTGASFWADSAFIAGAGIPTVLFGPGGEGAHAAE